MYSWQSPHQATSYTVTNHPFFSLIHSLTIKNQSTNQPIFAPTINGKFQKISIPWTMDGFHFLTYHYLRKFQNTLPLLCPQNLTVTNPAYPLEFPLKHVSDQSLCLSSASRVISLWYLRAKKVHNNSVFKELTVLFLLQKSHLWNRPMPADFQSYILVPPIPLESRSKSNPSPSEILESSPRYRYMDIFWNCPIMLVLILKKIYYFSLL